MKKLLLILFIIAASINAVHAQKQLVAPPKVDRNVELVSIVFRLAGNHEYNSKDFKSYTDIIDQYFDPYKDHELIQYTREIVMDRGIGYDAPMGLAVSLDADLNPFCRVNDERWTDENIENFVALLKEFYKATDFDTFFAQNQELYDTIAERFLTVYSEFDSEWYSHFYGKAPEEIFQVIVAPSNGGNNYGPSSVDPEGVKTVYSIVGLWQLDGEGMPVFATDSYLPLMIHEFNHSFVNPMLANNTDMFKETGERLFAVVEDEMRRMAYSYWTTMWNEALVRAAVIKYLIDHQADPNAIRMYKNYELKSGFLWMELLVEELEKYDADREKYPTLEDYLPELVSAYDEYAEKIEEFDINRPRVVLIEEFENFATDVDPSIKTITVRFSKPMIREGRSVFQGRLGRDAFPNASGASFSDDCESFVMDVSLEPDKLYQFVYVGHGFVSEDGYPLKTYEVSFKTAEQ